ncbi:macrolide family glycosyltransferase [Lacrimispora algidixylanolytica]|uniref:Glycosyl transferase n=1 Tax=Lacrimispora algidixylanolytica TaxID=94868 RepID=A0A419T0Z6_9FIRM|nr:macrolide family glycosyltransferase [Lacrimispora algidixylanolytica]RKD31132.1 glycosyl transferase [Lacrimispora algidixylanolytica]
MISKKKILMVNLPFSGHTNPTLGLAKVITSLGHEVTFVQSPDWKSKVEKTGAHFIPYDHYPETLSPSQKEIKSWGAAYDTVKRIGHDYDCLIYEMLFLPGKSLADELGIPSFRLFSTFSLNERVLKYFGQTGGWYMTCIFRYPKLCSLISKKLQKKFHLRYNSIEKEMVDNAPPLNFTYTIKEFQIYSNDFNPISYKYIGTALKDRETETSFQFPKLRFPLIYISLGTLLNTSTTFFKKCIQAFKDKPVTVIISIGTIVKAEKLGIIPDNIFIYPFVPQLEILKRTSLFITHGGMNSVNESIYYGVPMLVIPVGNDQPAVAKQIETLHMGKSISKKHLKPEFLANSAMNLLKDDSYKKTIQSYQAIMLNAGGNDQIAKEILEYLN